jgi:hypothetical protein
MAFHLRGDIVHPLLRFTDPTRRMALMEAPTPRVQRARLSLAPIRGCIRLDLGHQTLKLLGHRCPVTAI